MRTLRNAIGVLAMLFFATCAALFGSAMLYVLPGAPASVWAALMTALATAIVLALMTAHALATSTT